MPAQHVTTHMTGSLVFKAPAKLNLTLEVLRRRGDGLHAIRSLMVPVDLADELIVERRPGPLAFSCDDPALSSGNLVEDALRALDLPERGFSVRLNKRIPTGAGMGGGSSDAASVLLAAQSGAFGPLPERDYLAIARSLGSDVPFFLVESGALVEGTGERVTAVGALPAWHAAIVKPPVAVSTSRAYATLDATERAGRPRNDSVTLRAVDAIQRGAFDEVAHLLHNDFESPIASQFPEVARTLAALRDAGAEHPLLTGSGSCVFALARDAQALQLLVARLSLPPEYTVYVAAFARAGAWRGEA